MHYHLNNFGIKIFIEFLKKAVVIYLIIANNGVLMMPQVIGIKKFKDEF